MKLKNNTKEGFVEALEGDGVVINYVHNKNIRGRRQEKRSPTLQTDGGGSTGVMVMANEELTIRKLTEGECLRLMAFNDEEIARLKTATDDKGKPLFARTVLYRFAGNSVVVDTYKCILESILADWDAPVKAEPKGQMSLESWGVI